MEHFKTSGVCSTQINFEVKDDIVTKVIYTAGCNGNAQGISRLVEGMSVAEVIKKLKGTTCGRKSTSCPDQLAIALEKYTNQK